MDEILKKSLLNFSLLATVMGSMGVLVMMKTPVWLKRWMSQWNIGGLIHVFFVCFCLIWFGIQSYFWLAFR